MTDREGCSLPLTGKAAWSQTLLKTKVVQRTTGITEGQRSHRHQNREMKRGPTKRHLSPHKGTISNKMKTLNLFKDQRIHRLGLEVRPGTHPHGSALNPLKVHSVGVFIIFYLCIYFAIYVYFMPKGDSWCLPQFHSILFKDYFCFCFLNKIYF